MCGEPDKALVGETLTLSGWAARRRDHGGLIFVDLRDRTGITQLVINPELAPEAAELAHQIRNEFVLRAEGTLVARSAETVNPNMPTGEVELQVEQARDRQPLDAAAVPARRGERRRDAAPALSLARPAPREAAAEHHACARRWSGSSGARWRRRASSTSRRRSCSSRRPRARATSSSRAGSRRAASTRCRRARRSSSS